MISFLLWLGAVIWVVILLQFLINVTLAVISKRDLSRLVRVPVNKSEDCPLISIVVPARDEELAVEEAVTAFCEQDYPNFEVIVVDDRSIDKTPAILARLAEKYQNLKVITGDDPPAGWLGKPNALETGRRAAKGEWILFADADAVYAPPLLRGLLAYALKTDAGMVAVMPSFITKGRLEAVIMSELYFLFLAAAPMFLATHSKNPLFAGGSGSGNFVRRDALIASGAFVSLKDEVADDVGLGFKIKGAGFSLAGTLSGPLLKIRMYNGAADTVRGFTKNSYPIMAKYPAALPASLLASLIMTFLPYYAFLSGLLGGSINIVAITSLLIMHFILGVICALLNQPWYVALLSPVRDLAWLWILVRSFVMFKTKGIVWRGRVYKQ